jgi:putative membrane protein
MSYLNDPRVLFAAERTLLAYNRTSLALMAFGFAVERFTLFARMVQGAAAKSSVDVVALALALALVCCGVAVNVTSIRQHKALLRSLSAQEIPAGHSVNAGIWINAVVALLGVILALYLLKSSVNL